MAFLDKISNPGDLRQFSPSELKKICAELREFLQQQTQEKEGHILSSLGVTELVVALHYSFNTPHDILIWDVGHQAYIHKIVTGRKDRFYTNRMKGGISGFTKRSESEYDPFGAGHSSTSISAAAGFALADRAQRISRQHIAVIGDGALTGGMSFEALNFIGEYKLNVLVILNDNQSSIDENRGALALLNSYGEYFHALGFQYDEIENGNDVELLINEFQKQKNDTGPRALKINTQKGLGRIHKETIAKKTVETSFQSVFASEIIKLAEEHRELMVISPAMLAGAKLHNFKEVFPDRVYDVGIAEQNAVTMAAGMAAAGLHPLVHLYSTFAQRAYDQIIHDVALQNLPVIFCLDRAGLAGEDGPTHHGSFDTGFLNTIPNLVISAPSDGESLKQLMKMAVLHRGPFFIRYPKANCGTSISDGQLHFGKARLIKPGKEKAVLSFGSIGAEVAHILQELPYAHYDFPFLKPLDEGTLQHIFSEYEAILTLEENSARGGFGDTVRSIVPRFKGKIESIALPDKFVEHGSRSELLAALGFDAASIRQKIISL